MKKLLAVVLAILPLAATAQEFAEIPARWKWISDTEAVFSKTGRYSGGDDSFSVIGGSWVRQNGVKAQGRYAKMPVKIDGAENLTYSPDSTLIAYTLGGNLYVLDIERKLSRQLTSDGSDVILNGYASWVYYEEIFGRASNYCAFWWSPDSRKLAFYRFDDSEVPMFPIYSPFGQDGKLRRTHYPKAGEKNPGVKIGFVEVGKALEGGRAETVWAQFDYSEDGYFGKPFWSKDSEVFYVAREPRIQNTLDLYAVEAATGRPSYIYHETYDTWLDWIDRMLFTDKGFYMVRSFETLWQQIYFLSYDGKEFRRITDGTNWDVELQKVLPDGSVAFTAKRDSQVRAALYKVDRKGRITALTNPDLDARSVSFSPDGRYFVVSLSNLNTPPQVWMYETESADLAWKARLKVDAGTGHGAVGPVRRHDTRYASKAFKVADMKGPDFSLDAHPMPEIRWIEVGEGLEIPAKVVLPVGFDPSKQYPVHVDIYGGPDTPLVRDSFEPYPYYQFYAENGIIQVTADCRASGHNGRAGLDQIYKKLATVEVDDFVSWARYFQSLPYVKADKIGVEGFSFGGTMTAKLLLTAPDAYHYGIAGGGVYDWMLYDTHYTERFMSTPQDNPEGYKETVLKYAKGYPTDYLSEGGEGYLASPEGVVAVEPVMLKITHGTGDDNVHFQNTLQLIDKLQLHGKKFEFMVYPDGMHGYRGAQGRHFNAANCEFWLKYLNN